MLQVAKLKQSSAQEKAAKKAEKKASKEAKKDKKRAASQLEAALAAKGVGPHSVAIAASARHHPAPGYRDSDHRHTRDRDARHGSDRHARGSTHNGHMHDSSHVHKQRRLHSPERLAKPDHDRHGDDGRAHRDSYSDRHHTSEHDRQQHDGTLTESARVSSRHRNDGEANGHQPINGKDHDRQGGTQYGLSWGETAPEELQARDRCILLAPCLSSFSWRPAQRLVSHSRMQVLRNICLHVVLIAAISSCLCWMVDI